MVLSGFLGPKGWHNYFEADGSCGYSDARAWEPEEVEENLYGYGFSYVYRRALAVRQPYPELDFKEDAPFMLKLRQFCRVGFREDQEGYCLHVVHSESSCVDPEVSCYLSDEQLRALEVARSHDLPLHLGRPRP